MNAVATIPPRSVLVDMSTRYGMEPGAFEATLRATVCKGNVSREEFAAFLLVAKEYGLNPMTKELYAFPAKGGGIQPIVSIDGWARIINDHPQFDGMEFEDVREGDALIAITCRMHRKDRSRSIEATEYMDECKRSTDVWKTWPRRMLRHKAMIQCARYAFGFSGIVDPDEFERMEQARDVTPRPSPGIAARLADQSGAREGFSAVHAGLDPEDKIPDSDAASPGASEEPASDPHPPSDAGHTLSDDAKPSDEGDAAGSAEAHADEVTGPAASVVVWADRLIAELPFMAPGDVEKLEGDRHHHGRLAMLQATDAEKAAALAVALSEARGQ